jgi:hypothetical protein
MGDITCAVIERPGGELRYGPPPEGEAEAAFDPAEARDRAGKWSTGPGGVLKRTAKGRIAAQTPSQFVHPDTGHAMGKTEIGDTYEALFAAKGAQLLEARFGGPFARVSGAETAGGGRGARNTPLDFRLDHTRAGELKTMNFRARSHKTAIKKEEVARKEAAARDAGMAPLLVVQVVDAEHGRAEVFAYPAFASKTTTAMEHLGGYWYGPGDFQAAQEATGHWAQRHDRAAAQGVTAAASPDPPPEDPDAEPGDTVIELRDGVPWIGTQPDPHGNPPEAASGDLGDGEVVDVTAAFDPGEARDPHGKWVSGAVSGLAVRQRIGYHGHDIDRTRGKGYRVRLKSGEVQHYEHPEHAAKAAVEGKHFTPGEAKPEAPAKLEFDRAFAVTTIQQATRNYGNDTYGWQKDAAAGRVRKVTVPVSKVRLLQEPFPGKLAEYAGQLKGGRDVGRPVAVKAGDLYLLLDGNHKATARVQAGATSLDLDVVTPHPHPAPVKTGELDYTPLLDRDFPYDKITTGGGQDEALKAIAAMRGFDGPPHLVDDAAIDRRVAAGEPELFRGFNGINGGQEDQTRGFANQFLHGDYFAGAGGYGNGTYLSHVDPAPLVDKVERDWADVPRDEHGQLTGRDRAAYEKDIAWARSRNKLTAAGYASSHGTLARMTLDKGARVITWDDLRAKWQAAVTKLGVPDAGDARAKREAALLRDPGRYAAVLGYDAIDVSKAGEMVVLNRTKLHISTRLESVGR